MPMVSVVTDENQVLELLSSELAGENFTCSLYSEADEGTPLTCDLVILDADCYSGLRALSQGIFSTSQVPIIILGKMDTIIGLNGHLYKNEFIAKPYDIRELVIRAKRLLHGNIEEPDIEPTVLGDLSIDTARCEVKVAGHIVELTFREYELLKFLAGNPGRVFTRNVLLDQVWDQEYLGGDRTVDVHVRRLRSKIEVFGHSYIETVRHVGYRFRHSP